MHMLYHMIGGVANVRHAGKILGPIWVVVWVVHVDVVPI